MSRNPFPYMPDPDKWIETAPLPKKPMQRPLATVRDFLSTPPATLKRNAHAGPGPSSSAMRGRTGNTPIKEGKQLTLNGFLTPPETKRRVAKPGRSGLRGENLVQRGSPMPKELSDGNQARRKASVSTERRPGRISRMASSNSSDAIDLAMDHRCPLSPAAPIIPPSGTSPARPPSHISRTPKSRSEPEHPPSRRQSTRVPEDVLDIHRKLCGQVPKRQDSHSLWQKLDNEAVPSSATKGQRLDNAARVTRRAVDKTTNKGGKTKALVDLSEEALPPRPRPLPLAVIPPNSPRVRRRSPRQPSKISKQVRSPWMREAGRRGTRSASRSPIEPVSKAIRPEEAADVPDENQTPVPHTDRQKKLLDGVTQSRVTPGGRQSLLYEAGPIRGLSSFTSGPPPSSPPPAPTPSDHGLPQVSTPRKRTPTHHRVTPPKISTPHIPRRWQEYHGTLFDFPPPPQPRFDNLEPEPKVAFEPADMEPETLMTWSLGRVPRAPASSRTPTGDVSKRPDGIAAHLRRPTIHPLATGSSSRTHWETRSPGGKSEVHSVRPCQTFLGPRLKLPCRSRLLLHLSPSPA